MPKTLESAAVILVVCVVLGGFVLVWEAEVKSVGTSLKTEFLE